MTIYHTHHIIPRHMGGSDDPSNLIRLTVEEHAEAHRILYEKYGLEQDRLAWLGLAGIMTKQEHNKEVSRLAGKKTVEMQAGIHDPNLKYLKSLGGKKAIIKMPKWTANSKWMNNGHKDTRVSNSEVISFLSKGWVLGRICKTTKGKIGKTKNTLWINKSGNRKRVPAEKVDEYISAGWSLGM